MCDCMNTKGIRSRNSSQGMHGSFHNPSIESSDKTVDIYFKYIGETRLMTIGPITGNHYNFERPEVVIPVDRRDGASLARISKLRLVKKRSPANSQTEKSIIITQ